MELFKQTPEVCFPAWRERLRVLFEVQHSVLHLWQEDDAAGATTTGADKQAGMGIQAKVGWLQLDPDHFVCFFCI